MSCVICLKQVLINKCALVSIIQCRNIGALIKCNKVNKVLYQCQRSIFYDKAPKNENRRQFRTLDTTIFGVGSILLFKNKWNISYLNSQRGISKCSVMKTKDSNDPIPDERIQKVLDDAEFQNILQDFAKDFGVGEESNKILDDIRKNYQDPPKDGDDTNQSNISDENITCKDDAMSAYYSLAQEKFKEFSDQDSTTIHSFEEEQSDLIEEESFFHIDQEHKIKKKNLVVKRGVTGVYDIEELVMVLREENLLDICVIKVPESLHYVDYMVLATAKSLRHSEAAAEVIRKLYKMKKNKKDVMLHIEGEKLSTWKAMDMGNIVLHVFMEETRASYDIESLWLLDKTYDSGGSVQKDSVMDMIQEEMDFLNALKPDETSWNEKLV